MCAYPSRSFDPVADRYDDSRGGPRRGARMVADLATWLAPGRVLEVGVGTGVISAALVERGRQVHGVDLSAGMLRRALARLGPRVVQGDALALPIASATVDNVVFVAALHAIGDIGGAVAEAARVLRPGGRLVAIHGVPRREPADDEIAKAIESLAPLRDARPDTIEVMDAAAAAAGLAPAGTGWVAPAHFAESPNTVADGLAERLWSYLWHLDDHTWQAVVAPVIAGLRALPNPDQPRDYSQSSRLTAYTHPG